MEGENILDTSGLTPGAQETIGGFLKEIEEELKARRLTRERVEEILETFRGDLQETIDAFGELGTEEFAEILLEEDEAPLQNNPPEDQALEEEVDNLLKRLGQRLKKLFSD